MASKVKIQKYRRLNGKYLKDAEVLLKKGDYSQASEKFWGACAEIVKAAAARKNIHLKTHGDLWDYVLKLHEENPTLNLATDFGAVNHLHSNFYEEDLSATVVSALAQTSRDFIKKMEKFLG
jgi:uncharacterized protein (UPF0332 family)